MLHLAQHLLYLNISMKGYGRAYFSRGVIDIQEISIEKASELELELGSQTSIP
jgi:hypothetical protein